MVAAAATPAMLQKRLIDNKFEACDKRTVDPEIAVIQRTDEGAAYKKRNQRGGYSLSVSIQDLEGLV